MRPFAKLAGAAIVGAAALAATAPAASARGWHHWHHWGHWRHHSGAAWGLGLGLLSGVVIGDALAAPYYPDYPYYYGPYVYAPPYPVYRYRVYPRRYYRPGRLSQAHVDWCYAHYRSYRAFDNTYQPYHGPRRACISPYG